MKSEIIQEQPEDSAIEYPCLMQLNSNPEFIVLFSSDTTGMVILNGHSHCWEVGDYSNKLVVGNFKPFKGKLVLSND